MSLTLGLVLVALAGLPPAASASYPGRAGEVVYQDSYSTWDPLSNGTITYHFYLRATMAPASATTTLLTCQGYDMVFKGAPQFCPESGSGFSPDGQIVVSAGVEYQVDGSSVPDQSTCSSSSSCPQGIILAGADGSGPRLLPVPITYAEHPAFMPDGQTLVFAGRMAASAPADLYAVKTDGTGLTRVTTDGGSDPAPCANGSVVYVHRGNLYLLSSNLRTRRRLTYRGGRRPDCSHDSRTFVFLRRSTLYTLNTTGRHLRRLSAPGVAGGRPAFSPSGGEIAFSTKRMCTLQCGAHFPQCTNLTYRLELIDFRGRARGSDLIGRNYCSGDGDLGGDHPGDVAWQPLPAG